MPRKPKPFQRPSITLGARNTKEWVDTTVDQLSEQDLIAGRGLIEKVDLTLLGIDLTFANGSRVSYPENQIVRAFTKRVDRGNSN